MKMAPEVDPCPGRVPEMELLNPELGFWLVAELCRVSGKILQEASILGHIGFYSQKPSGGESRGAGAAPTRG